ncbi:MAG: family 43 glycosylhydrolase [Bacteroidales bacterium]|nr:family 43 glycosylhydrolase [Bacteroidales bacterium]
MRKLPLLLALMAVIFSGCNSGAKYGYYENPVLGGDHPDPSIVRVGTDYYMTYSTFEYYPGLPVLHSTDMINWERIGFALSEYLGPVWAPDLVFHNDLWYIYFPSANPGQPRQNYVVWAETPYGPWSEPIDLKIPGFIDPGHIVDADGNRYLYLSKGYIIKLTPDGLATAGEPEFVYETWRYPEDWIVECLCLESPKAKFINGYYYMMPAIGGTAGPATGHMVAVSRSKTPFGPWEHSPHNPIIRTQDRSERWWNQGHGTMIDDIDGNWYIMYHGYENRFQTLGRQALLMPIVWTEDGWFHIPDNIKSSAEKLPKPAGTPFVGNAKNLSDDFSQGKLGLQWQFFKKFQPERIDVANGVLTMKADGKSLAETTPILVTSMDRHYEVVVEYEIEDGVSAGLTLWYDEKANLSLTVDNRRFRLTSFTGSRSSADNDFGNRGFMKVINDHNEIRWYCSADGKDWKRIDRISDISGYNHNTFHQFLSVRAGLYVFGEGSAKFRNFTYTTLEPDVSF